MNEPKHTMTFHFIDGSIKTITVSGRAFITWVDHLGSLEDKRIIKIYDVSGKVFIVNMHNVKWIE